MAFTTALYLRISQDDENQDESNSIASQRNMLTSFTTTDPILSVGETLTFIDDGWSGTNFERPQVKDLLSLARRGCVQCIVVKDLSRWGRNSHDVSEYLDQIFPFLGIRFISLGEGYDSAAHIGQTAPMDVAFSAIMHDIYSKELSLKVRQSHMAKMRRGEHVIGVPPFGYTKTKETGNKLVVFEEEAVVVRRIFLLLCDGIPTNEVAATFNKEGIPSPKASNSRKGRTPNPADGLASTD